MPHDARTYLKASIDLGRKPLCNVIHEDSGVLCASVLDAGLDQDKQRASTIFAWCCSLLGGELENY